MMVFYTIGEPNKINSMETFCPRRLCSDLLKNIMTIISPPYYSVGPMRLVYPAIDFDSPILEQPDSVQYNGGLLPEIILSTRCSYIGEPF